MRGLLVCHDCRRRKRHPLDFARAAVPYDGLARDLILKAKFRGRRRAIDALAEVILLWLAAETESDAGFGFQNLEGLVPVPLHWLRRLRRGYNQSQLLAERLAGPFGTSVTLALRRVRATRPQVGLDPVQRRRNVADAFEVVHKQVVKGGYYLLIDDVYTTGATLRECARTLRRAGAGRVAALTATRPLAPDLKVDE